jgi:hypothetical protein
MGLLVLGMLAMRVELKGQNTFPMDLGSSTTSDKYSPISSKTPSKTSIV